MPTTPGRRVRQGVRPGAGGAAAEHMPKIVATSATLLVVIAFMLVMTKIGHDIDAATQRFMLFYAGVFALLGLTGSVLVGLVATDRVIMTPGHRVMAQAVHRAFSFGALAFLVIHIVTEILAQRAHVIDAFIPFLSPFRTYYIGLGTIASDLILLIMVTSILRKRFTANGRAWRWRAIHYSSYAAFVLGVLHGLLGGRTAKPYVDWSYGFAIALTALGLAVRFLATSLRPKESLSAPPAADRAGSRSSPLHAAAMTMAQAQLGGTIQVLPGGTGLPGTRAALAPAQGWSPHSGPLPAVGTAHGYSADHGYTADPAEAAYANLGFVPLGAPPYGDALPTAGSGHATAETSRAALAGPAGSSGPGRAARQPLYEPGYDGPPRFVGAPRNPLPQDGTSSYPYGAQDNDGRSGRSQPGSRRALGPYGPSEPHPARGERTTGPLPRADSGPMPRLGTGPLPRADSGPMPRLGTGPLPRADSGPLPRAGTPPMSRAGSRAARHADSGPLPRLGTGPMPRADSGPLPRADSGPMPRLDSGPVPRHGSGPMPRPGTVPRAATGPLPRVDAGWPGSSGSSGPMPAASPPGPADVAAPSAPGPSTRPMPRAATRSHRRPDPADPRYRQPRPDRSDEW